MLSEVQKQVLKNFIGPDGIYVLTILENTIFDLGTKILYLERAISQECHEFLQSLDKLYDPSLQDDAKRDNLDFIRALNTINNLCFNNEVKYGEFGSRSALTHFFGSLGVFNPDAFRYAIRTSINSRINALREGHELELTEQKKVREQAEANITRQTGWRVELDLPIQMQQLVPTIAQLLDVTAEQFQQLPENLKLLIARYPDATRQLIQECGATFVNFQGLTAVEFRELLYRLREVSCLVNDVHFPLADLLAFERQMRTKFICNAFGVDILVNRVHFPLADLLTIEQEIRIKLIENANEVDTLVNDVNIPLADLLMTESNLRTELIDKAFEIGQLVLNLHMPLSDLLALNQDVRTELIDNTFRLDDLFTDVNVLFEKLPHLSVEQLRIVLNAPLSEAAQDILNPSATVFRL